MLVYEASVFSLTRTQEQCACTENEWVKCSGCDRRDQCNCNTDQISQRHDCSLTVHIMSFYCTATHFVTHTQSFTVDISIKSQTERQVTIAELLNIFDFKKHLNPISCFIGWIMKSLSMVTGMRFKKGVGDPFIKITTKFQFVVILPSNH